MRMPYRVRTPYRRYAPSRTTSASGPMPSMFKTGQNIYNTYKKYRSSPTTGPIIRAGEEYVRSKLGRSFRPMVKAMNLTKMRFSTHSSTPGEISYSSYKHGRYRPSYFKTAIKTAQRFNYIESGSAHTTFITGEQGVSDLFVLDGARLYSLAQKARTVYGSGTLVNPDNYNVWLGTVKTTVRFSNPGLSSLSVDVYNYDARRDINDVTINGTCSLATAWSYGASYENIVGSYSASRLGASPLDVSLTGRYYKLRKKTTIQLPPGAEHIHVITYHINRLYSSMMDKTVVDNEITSSHVGFTHGMLVVPSGAVVFDDVNPTQVDTANGALNFVYDTSYEMFNFTGQQGAVEYVDNTGVVTAPKIVVVQNPTEITP